MTWTSIAPASTWLDSFPIGAITPYSSASIPTGWLLCDGSAVSRTTYSDLFTVIGTTWGTGDGSSTFNLPDLRGRAIYGKGSNTDVNALGNNDGVAEASRTPKHTHTGPSHTHNIPASSDTGWGSSGGAANRLSVYGSSAEGAANDRPSGSGGTGATGSSFGNYAIANYIIKSNATAITVISFPLSIANGGTGATTATNAFNALSPLTTLGDIIYRDASNNVRLAANSTATKKYLQSVSSGAPSWQQVDWADLSSVPSTFTPAAHDMITKHTYTGGAALDVFGLSAANTIARLTPSADVSAGTSAILKSDASGYLTLKRLGVGATPSYRIHITDDTDGTPIQFRVANTVSTSRANFSLANNQSNYVGMQMAGSAYYIPSFYNIASIFCQGSGINALVINTNGETDTGGTTPIKIGAGGFSNVTMTITPGNPGTVLIGTATAAAPGSLLRVAGHVTCDADAASDLGRSDLRWGTIYLGGTGGTCKNWNNGGTAITTSQTIIADGTNDVTSNITILYSVKPSTGTASGGVVNLAVNTDSIVWSNDAGTEYLTITCASNGSVTIARTGTLSYAANLWLVWI